MPRREKIPNSTPWAAHTRGDVWIFAFLIGVLFLAGIVAVGYASEGKHADCLVQQKQVDSQRVLTSCGNFQVNADPARGLSKDDERFASLEEGKEYDFVVAGWDYVGFRIHPNILSATPHSND